MPTGECRSQAAPQPSIKRADLMIEAIPDTAAVFAECPVWLPGPQCLFWVDCTAGRLLSLDWRSRTVKSVLFLPGTLFSGLVRHDETSLLLLTGAGALVVDLRGRTTPFALPEAIDAGLINDGKTDPAGRLWLGQVRSAPGMADGALHRVSAAGSELAVTGLGIPNGPAFSPCGAAAYFADSLAGTIEALAVDRSGALGGRRRLLALPAEGGQPDGMTVDAAGHIVAAIFDGGALVRINPVTLVAERIPMPVQRPTSCAFGGADSRTLFVTVANGSWPRDRRNPGRSPPVDPKLPSLYAIPMMVPGVPEPNVSHGSAGATSLTEVQA